MLARTPFYAEGGGQLADQGVIRTGGAEVEIVDVQSPLAGARRAPGQGPHRRDHRSATRPRPRSTSSGAARISRSHTATHLVHRGFRNALGETAAQAGSENSPGRFRFDFTASGAVPPSVLRDVEDEVNAVLINDLKVNAFYTSQAEARAMGALALFGEKYGDEVRVVEIGDYSRELCGGTHVHSSGQLGLVKVLGEQSIGAGVRRVEALVGIDAFRFLARESVLVAQLSEQLKAPPRGAARAHRGHRHPAARPPRRSWSTLRSAQVLQGAGELAAQARDLQRSRRW